MLKISVLGNYFANFVLDNFFANCFSRQLFFANCHSRQFANCCTGQFFCKLLFWTILLQIIISDNLFANCCSGQLFCKLLFTTSSHCCSEHLCCKLPFRKLGQGQSRWSSWSRWSGDKIKVVNAAVRLNMLCRILTCCPC